MMTATTQSTNQSIFAEKSLSGLLNGVEGVGDLDLLINKIMINGLTLDSRTVAQGDLFFAIPGHEYDGRQFAQTAIDQEASAVLYESEKLPNAYMLLAQTTNAIGIKNLQSQISQIAANFYDHPSKSMKVIGVTGTNGKTTCAYLLTQALNLLGEDCAMMGTIGVGRLDQLTKADLTTGDALSIQQNLKNLQDQGVTAVCMEISSHGLDQGRTNAVDIDVAVFTNFTQDHLNYHGDMAAYAKAKQKLFEMECLNSIVSNQDDFFGRELLKQAKVDTLSYGLNDADLSPEQIKINAQGICFNLTWQNESVEIKSSLLGAINVPNLLATIAVLLKLDYSIVQIAAVMPEIKAPPGRMELFPSQQNGAPVIVDYSHTPDSLERALQSLQPHCEGNLWVVFGCGGDRDQAKRSVMGEAAMANADHVIITNDNPRTESAEIIVQHILEGIDQYGNRVEIIYDRKQAIKTAIEKASAQDIVLIAGKGHEQTQTIGEIKHPFSDRTIVQTLQGGEPC